MSYFKSEQARQTKVPTNYNHIRFMEKQIQKSEDNLKEQIKMSDERRMSFNASADLINLQQKAKKESKKRPPTVKSIKSSTTKKNSIFTAVLAKIQNKNAKSKPASKTASKAEKNDVTRSADKELTDVVLAMTKDDAVDVIIGGQDKSDDKTNDSGQDNDLLQQAKMCRLIPRRQQLQKVDTPANTARTYTWPETLSAISGGHVPIEQKSELLAELAVGLNMSEARIMFCKLIWYKFNSFNNDITLTDEKCNDFITDIWTKSRKAYYQALHYFQKCMSYCTLSYREQNYTAEYKALLKRQSTSRHPMSLLCILFSK